MAISPLQLQHHSYIQANRFSLSTRFCHTDRPSDDDFGDFYDEVFGKTELKLGGVAYLGPIGPGLDLFATNEATGGRVLIRFSFDPG